MTSSAVLIAYIIKCIDIMYLIAHDNRCDLAWQTQF